MNTDDAETLAELKTNGFGFNPALSIGIGTVVGMQAMFVAILLKLHPFVAMAALLGGILAVFGVMGGRMEYRLTTRGLHRWFRPFLGNFLPIRGRARFFHFAEIVSYKREKDLARSMREVEVLKITVRTAPFHVWINDQVNPVGFRRFADAFVEQVESVNQNLAAGHTPGDPETTDVVETKPVQHPIKRRKGFYSTVFAKVLTVVFVWATLALAAAFFLGEARATQLIRFGIVILPGTAYMVYRVFLKR